MDESATDSVTPFDPDDGPEFLRIRHLVVLLVVSAVVLVAGLVVLSSGESDQAVVVVPSTVDVRVGTSEPRTTPPVTTTPTPLPVITSTTSTTSTTDPLAPTTTVFAPAVAEAGEDRMVDVGEDVALVAVDLSEPNQSVVWRQITGPDVTGGTGRLIGAAVGFVAPDRPATLTFEMVVTGRAGDTALDMVRVDVFADSSAAVFVDVSGGADSGDGSRERPFRSIAAAVASTPPGSDLYLRSGSEPHVLADAVLAGDRSIYGGYGADWAREGGPTRIEAAAGLRFEGAGSVVVSGVVIIGGDSAERSVGVSASGLDSLVLEDVEIAAGRSTGGASVGVEAIDVGTVEILRSTVRAGRGADGTRGTTGRSGRPDGVDGASAVGTTGGRGGGDGGDGEDGAAPGGSGDDGGDGSDGSAGVDGLPGSGLAAPDATGASGRAGGSGGSGSGGAGGSRGVSLGDLAGGGGGGGGGGGAGGRGGGGGGGGFGSIGVSLVDVGEVRVVDSTISGGTAGRGGAGGGGGRGAAGGAGGAGGDGESDGDTSAGAGGSGGAGGAGGRGGSGGAGAGGTSVGLLTARVGGLVLLDSTITGGAGGGGGATGNGGDSIGWWSPLGPLLSGDPLIERTALGPGTPGSGGRALDRLGIA
ncbi:MAG: hypothetical protein ACO225_04515 [Ilumatobacteraceae bacterium]